MSIKEFKGIFRDNQLPLLMVVVVIVTPVVVVQGKNNFPYLYPRTAFGDSLISPQLGNIRDAFNQSRNYKAGEYRLRNESTPLHYDLYIRTSVHNGEMSFQGKLNIDIHIEKDTPSLTLHSRDLTIFNAQIIKHSAQGYDSDDLKITFDKNHDFLILSYSDEEKSFIKDTDVKLNINYKGELRTDNIGFYLSTYRDSDNKLHYLGATQFESVGARHAFPCYDEPSKRATFRLTVEHSTSYNVISNMPIESVEDIDDGYTETVFEKTVRMPTYLLAFIVSDFDYSSGHMNELEQRIYSRPGTDHQQEWALYSGMLIMQRLSEYFDQSFVLPKIDQAALPDFTAGAMENWGLATYQEEFLLYDPVQSSVYTQTNVAHIIGHEYTHQWFGNLVGIAWWSYLWLKEGFATLYSYKAVDDAYPEWGIWQQFHATDYQSALEVDASGQTHPLTNYVETTPEIRAMYDSISYSKGAAVLDMWNHGLPSGVFRQGLSKYLKDNQFNSVVEDNLFEALQTTAKAMNVELPVTIEEMFTSWTHQSGYPLLTVTRDYENGKFLVNQTSYVTEPDKPTKLWYIPLNYAIEDKENFQNTSATHYLLGVADIVIEDPALDKDKWLILNKQSTGFYRIQYDERNWNLIIEGLKKAPHRIHPRNRAQLLNDAFNLCLRGQLKHEILMDLMVYIEGGVEDQFAPWSILNGILKTLARFLQGEESDTAIFKKFVVRLVETLYERLGVQDVSGEHHYRKYTRNLVILLACAADHEHCLHETQELLSASIQERRPIAVNLANSVYCSALRYASQEDFNYVLEQLRKSDNQAERRLLISALGCSQISKNLEKFLENIVDFGDENRLRPQERITMLAAAYTQGDHGLLAAIHFLQEHWQEYAGMMAGFAGLNLLSLALQQMSNYVMNTEQETKFLELVKLIRNSSEQDSDNVYVTDTLQELILANIQSNKDWVVKHRDPLIKYMQEHCEEQTSDDESNQLVWLIAGPVIGGILLVVIIFVICKYSRKSKSEMAHCERTREDGERARGMGKERRV